MAVLSCLYHLVYLHISMLMLRSFAVKPSPAILPPQKISPIWCRHPGVSLPVGLAFSENVLVCSTVRHILLVSE